MSRGLEPRKQSKRKEHQGAEGRKDGISNDSHEVLCESLRFRVLCV